MELSVAQAQESLMSAKLDVDDDFKTRAIVMVEEILGREHSERGKKQVKIHRDRIQYACPYCGDSSKDPWKKRGNLYWDSLQCHCFNGGCPSPHVSFADLLTDFGYTRNDIRDEFGSFSLIKKYISENRKQDGQFRRTRTDNSVKGDAFLELEKHGVVMEDMEKVLGARPVPESSKVYNYLRNRLQHRNVDRMRISKRGLIIFNMNSKRDRVVGLQIKTFKDKAKYLTYDIQAIYEELLGSKLRTDDPVMRERMNKLSTYFNVMHARLGGRLTIFEGPMDSFLFPNSVALCSSGKSTELFERLPNIRFLFDHDKAGKTASVDKLERGYPVFIWEKFLKDNGLEGEGIGDWNELLVHCYRNELDAHKRADEYFSDYIHDKFYLM